MEYEELVHHLICDKRKDDRYDFPAYLVSAMDRESDGILDPRYQETMKEKKEGTQSDYFYKGIPIGRIRDAMNCENRDISKGLVEESILHVQFSDHNVDIIMYRPFHTVDKLPCILYFHGGAYAGGSMQVTANICRALCDRSQMAVINVDYRLAPEYAYPKGSDDCYGCFNWIVDHAEENYINAQELYVAGDSAGGNYAINCCIREEELALYRIKGCFLYYPHVSMVETKDYPWRLDMYEIAEQDNMEIKKNMIGLKEVIRASEFYYLQGMIEPKDPLVSPLLYEHMEGFPPMLIMSAEFDYLRIQQEYFVQRLKEADRFVKMVQYQGMQHAFMDRIGFYPQAEAALIETCAFINEIKFEELRKERRN